jgi:SagB-type dehydrogenase family enzyme
VRLLLRISASLLCACATLLAEDSPARPLDAFSYDQLRMFLKGYNGDWRPQSDRENGIPSPPAIKSSPANTRRIALPKPAARSVDFQTLLESRRSVREFSKDPMPLADLGFLLWAAQGVVDTNSRTAPSAGGRYPLETYISAANVAELEPGIYRYEPATHSMIVVEENPKSPEKLLAACYGERTVAGAAAVLIWTATPYRTEWKYAFTAHRMIAMEAGHACQNALLAATTLGLGACPLLSYHQSAIDKWLGVDGREEFVIYLAAVGQPVRN